MEMMPGWMVSLACHDGTATVAVHGTPDPAVSSALLEAIEEAVIRTGSARCVDVAFAAFDGARENVYAGLAAMAHDASMELARERDRTPQPPAGETSHINHIRWGGSPQATRAHRCRLRS
jgi:hypothetical protein